MGLCEWYWTTKRCDKRWIHNLNDLYEGLYVVECSRSVDLGLWSKGSVCYV
jgi:hypothetical protein